MYKKNSLILTILLSMFLTTSLVSAQTTKSASSKSEPAETKSSGQETTSQTKTKNTRVSKRRTVAHETVAKLPEQPSLEDRLIAHRQAVRKGEQREASQPYLIEEITIYGLYKAVNGYGAFLKATNGRSFFGYVGMPFYDGEIAEIEADQIVFEQKLPNGKKHQVVKAYDPSALRNAALDKDEKKSDKASDKKKRTKKDADDDSEDAGTKDE